MKRLGLLLGVCLWAGLSGCTMQQLYASGQSWQRDQCFKLIDSSQRQACLQRAWMPYDQYQRELHADSLHARTGSY